MTAAPRLDGLAGTGTLGPTLGKGQYPDPPLVTVIPVTTPVPLIVAVAAAPDPLPIITILGGARYPLPPLVTLMLVTTPSVTMAVARAGLLG